MRDAGEGEPGPTDDAGAGGELADEVIVVRLQRVVEQLGCRHEEQHDEHPEPGVPGDPEGREVDVVGEPRGDRRAIVEHRPLRRLERILRGGDGEVDGAALGDAQDLRLTHRGRRLRGHARRAHHDRCSHCCGHGHLCDDGRGRLDRGDDGRRGIDHTRRALHRCRDGRVGRRGRRGRSEGPEVEQGPEVERASGSARASAAARGRPLDAVPAQATRRTRRGTQAAGVPRRRRHPARRTGGRGITPLPGRRERCGGVRRRGEPGEEGGEQRRCENEPGPPQWTAAESWTP